MFKVNNQYTLFVFAIMPMLLMLSSCATNMATKTKSPSFSMHLTGKIEQHTLLLKEALYARGYKAFTLTEDEKAQVASWPVNIHIKAFFGTWCHDSQREVPKLLKIMQQNQEITKTLFALDINKSDPSGTAKLVDVKFTPTFIIYLADIEIGRIIERPNVSLIYDINLMIQSQH